MDSGTSVESLTGSPSTSEQPRRTNPLAMQPFLMMFILQEILLSRPNNPTADLLASGAAGLTIKWLLLADEESVVAGMILGGGTAGLGYLALGALGLYELNEMRRDAAKDVMDATGSAAAITLGAYGWLTNEGSRNGIQLGQIVDFSFSWEENLASRDGLDLLHMVSLGFDGADAIQSVRELSESNDHYWSNAFTASYFHREFPLPQPPPVATTAQPVRKGAHPPTNAGAPPEMPPPPHYPVPKAYVPPPLYPQPTPSIPKQPDPIVFRGTISPDMLERLRRGGYTPPPSYQINKPP
jgi:hypothetical protein